MPILTEALLIFCLRATDVSVGTLRLLSMVRGRRLASALLGFLEASLFIFAISRIFQSLDNPWNMVAYASGFASGTALGITLERWIASGHVLARIISREKSTELIASLRQENFGVTVIQGEGQAGKVLLLFIAAARKRGKRLLELIKQIDPQAFITLEPLHQAFGGYLPSFVRYGGITQK